MSNFATYFEMGGYAGFIWPAYGLTAVVMVGLLVTSLRTLRSRERQLKVLQTLVPGRRGRSRDSSPQ